MFVPYARPRLGQARYNLAQSSTENPVLAAVAALTTTASKIRGLQASKTTSRANVRPVIGHLSAVFRLRWYLSVITSLVSYRCHVQSRAITFETNGTLLVPSSLAQL